MRTTIWTGIAITACATLAWLFVLLNTATEPPPAADNSGPAAQMVEEAATAEPTQVQLSAESGRYASTHTGVEWGLEVVDHAGRPCARLRFGVWRDGESEVSWRGESSEAGFIAPPTDMNPNDWLVVEVSRYLFVKARFVDLRGRVCGGVLKLPIEDEVTIVLSPWREGARATVSITEADGHVDSSLPACGAWKAVPRDALVNVGPSGQVSVRLPRYLPLELTPNVSGAPASPSSMQSTATTYHRFVVDWDASPKTVRVGFRITDTSRSRPPVSGRAWLVKSSGSTLRKHFAFGGMAADEGFVVRNTALEEGLVLRVIGERGQEWQRSIRTTDADVVLVAPGEYSVRLNSSEARKPWVGAAPGFEIKQVLTVTQGGVATSVNTDRYAGTAGAWWRRDGDRLMLGRLPEAAAEVWLLAESGEACVFDRIRAPNTLVPVPTVGTKTLEFSDLPFRQADKAIVIFEVKLPNSEQWIRVDAESWTAGDNWTKVVSSGMGGRFLVQWHGTTKEEPAVTW